MNFELTRHIALVGLPGCGKSTIGRHLARRWGLPWVDVDSAIEERIGCSIKVYFAKAGETAFRDVEQDVLKHLLADSSILHIFATGGGAVIRDVNREQLKARAHVVYLSASPQELARRLQKDTQRPLLQVDNPLKKMLELHAQRDPLYRDVAEYVVPSSGLSAAQVAQRVAMQLELSLGA